MKVLSALAPLLAAGLLGITAVIFLRVSIDLFTDGARKVARARMAGYGIKAWASGRKPPVGLL